jgi:hypothetical protein
MAKKFAFIKRSSHSTRTSDMQTQPKQSPSSEPEKRGIEFGLAASRDALDMANFHNSHYGTRRRPEDWLWEYQTYEPGKAVFAFAKDGDKLIATKANMPVYMKIGTDCVLSGRGESVLMLPPYRGTTLLPSLDEYLVKNSIDRGMQFLWGLTPIPKVSQKLGFTCYPDVQVWLRPGNIWADIVSRLRTKRYGTKTRLWRRIGSVGKLILRSLFLRTGNSKTIPQIQELAGYEIKKGEIDERCLRELLERLMSEHNNTISLTYDEKYLGWRVREHPFLKYDEYQVHQGGKLRACAFVVLFQGFASISEFLSEDRYATSLLLYTIIKDYAKKAGRFRFLANPRDPLAQDVFDQLRQFGFSVDRKTSESWNFSAKDLTGGKYEQVLDIRNWHVSGLCTEGFLY